jgi:hypothetical protein
MSVLESRRQSRPGLTPFFAARCRRMRIHTSRGSSFQTLCAITILPRISSKVGASRPICCPWHNTCFVAPTSIELVLVPRANSPHTHTHTHTHTHSRLYMYTTYTHTHTFINIYLICGNLGGGALQGAVREPRACHDNTFFNQQMTPVHPVQRSTSSAAKMALGRARSWLRSLSAWVPGLRPRGG